MRVVNLSDRYRRALAAGVTGFCCLFCTKKTAAPAVMPHSLGFTLLEVLVVVIIIGILSALAYASLADVIFTSRAKETAQTMRAFAERALAEGKRQNKEVKIELKLNTSSIQYNTIPPTIPPTSPVTTALGNGFSTPPNTAPNCITVTAGASLANFNGGVESNLMIGLSSLKTEYGYFAACDAKGYCGAAVKVKDKNSFVACIRRGANADWEAL